MIVREGARYVRRDGSVTPPLTIRGMFAYDTKTEMCYLLGDTTTEEALNGNYVYGPDEPNHYDLNIQ